MENKIKKNYLSIIRGTCFLFSFNLQYFLRIVVVYLLAVGVEPWVAVSIPIVFEFARSGIESFKPFMKLSVKVNFKYCNIVHILIFLALGFFITQCRTVWTIYPLVILMGVTTGIKYGACLKLYTQNKKLESICLICDERTFALGSIFGLLVSQIVYDFNPILYIIGFGVLLVVEIIISIFFKQAPKEDIMTEETTKLTKKERNDVLKTTIPFGIFVGTCWVALFAFDELAPLLSDKIGYFGVFRFVVTILVTLLITGKVIKKIKEKGKLMLTQLILMVISVVGIAISALTQNWIGLIISFSLMGICYAVGDPLRCSMMSVLSQDNRNKWVLMSATYYKIKTLFIGVAWFAARECVLNGISAFVWLAVGVFVLSIIFFLISNIINKRVINTTI